MLVYYLIGKPLWRDYLHSGSTPNDIVTKIGSRTKGIFKVCIIVCFVQAFLTMMQRAVEQLVCFVAIHPYDDRFGLCPVIYNRTEIIGEISVRIEIFGQREYRQSVLQTLSCLKRTTKTKTLFFLCIHDSNARAHTNGG